MARYSIVKPITSVQQESELKRKYGKLIESTSTHSGRLECTMRLQPTDESKEYTIRIVYSISKAPKVWMVNPPELVTVDGKKPHHLFPDGSLCVFYPRGREWNNSMFLAESFVPWVITWLSAYEFWQLTGKWVYPEKR